jgi:tetratricopeptide (TPR) repeat protein
VARAHTTLAALRRHERHLDTAGVEAARAVSASRALGAQSNGAPGTLRVLGASLEEEAALEHAKGHFESPDVDEAIAVRERLMAAAPANAQDRLALARAYELRAFCRRELDRLPTAETDAVRSRDLRAELAAREPENGEVQRLLGQSYDTLCSIQQLAGRANDAIASCRQSVAILERVATKAPDAPSIHDNLLLAYQRLGWVFQRNARLAEATTAFAASLAIAERFAAGEQRQHFLDRLADAHALTGDAAFAQGNLATAKEHFGQALALLATRPDTKDGFEALRTRRSLELELAEVEDLRGERAEAKRLRNRAIEHIVEGSIDANEERPLVDLARICLLALPTRDPSLRDAVARAIAVLEALRVEGADPKPRLAILAQAKRAL